MICSNCQKLQDRIEELEGLLGLPQVYFKGFSKKESQILGILLKRDIAPIELLIGALYDIDNDFEDPANTIRTHIRRIRKKGIKITTAYSFGYSISPEEKVRINDTYR